MTTIDDLEVSVRRANIAAAQTCLAAAVIQLQSAERQLLKSVGDGERRGPMYSLPDGRMRFNARITADLAAAVERHAERLGQS